MYQIKNSNKTNGRINYYFTIAIMSFIFIQSALPGDISSFESNVLVRLFVDITGWDLKVLSMVIRKVAHFTEFAVLGGCLTTNVRDFYAMKGISLGSVRVWFMSWMLGTAYAASDEIHQYFVPERACQLLDVCIDSAGVAVGSMIMVIVIKHRLIKNN